MSHTDIDVRDFVQDDNFTDMFFLPPLTPSNIKEVTLTGCGHPEITFKKLKTIIEKISGPLSNIFNECKEKVLLLLT